MEGIDSITRRFKIAATTQPLGKRQTLKARIGESSSWSHSHTTAFYDGGKRSQSESVFPSFR